jgi:CheY-like chemotaxis protein
MQDNPEKPLAHVLAIEDDAMLLRAFSDYLVYYGYRMTPIQYTGAEALDLAGLQGDGGLPDVIICDYHLPGDQSGIDVIQSLRALFATDIPAILFTGDADPDTARKAAAIPAAKLLLKPVRMQTLADEIAALLSP